MKTKMFAIHDSKAEAYLQPFTMRSKGEALRAFENTVNDPSTAFYKHSADYTLFEIAEYDEEKGEVLPNSIRVALANALELKKSSPTPVQ